MSPCIPVIAGGNNGAVAAGREQRDRQARGDADAAAGELVRMRAQRIEAELADLRNAAARMASQ